jgi:hypothetical protein
MWWAGALISVAAVFRWVPSLPAALLWAAGLPFIVVACAYGLLNEGFSPGHSPISHVVLTLIAAASFVALLVSSAVAAVRPDCHKWRLTSMLLIPTFVVLGIAVLVFVWSRLGL